MGNRLELAKLSEGLPITPAFGRGNSVIVTKQHPQHARFELANPNRLPDLSIRQEREMGKLFGHGSSNPLQRQRKRRPPVNLTLHIKPAIIGFHNPMDNGEPKTGSLGLCGDKGIEDATHGIF